MKNKFQKLTKEQQKCSFNLLQKSEELFNGTLGTWRTYIVVFESK